MKIFKSTYLIFLFFLIGCVTGSETGPSEEQLTNADYGSLQGPEQCQRITENQIKAILKPNIKALFKHGSCSMGYLEVPGLPVEFGYLQTGTVNYKDPSGSYTGFTGYKVLIKNGVAIRYCLVNRGEGYCGPRP
jgi:hypothetical protein